MFSIPAAVVQVTSDYRQMNEKGGVQWKVERVRKRPELQWLQLDWQLCATFRGAPRPNFWSCTIGVVDRDTHSTQTNEDIET